MSHPLEACYLKLKRADHHLRELRDAIDEFLESAPYTISFEADLETVELTLWASVRARPKSIEWGTMIGDVVHNLRSALDQLMWQLTIANGKTSPQEPMKKNSPWRDIAFPIRFRRRHPGKSPVFVPWTERPPKALWGVHPRVVQQLQDLQPFNRDIGDRRRHPLWILAELSNADKHRYVPLVTVLADLTAIEFPEIYGESISARILWKREPGPIGDRTKVAVVRVEGHVPQHVFPLPPEIFMQPKGTFDVAFAEGAPGFGEPVIATLADLYLTVQILLLQFEPAIET